MMQLNLLKPGDTVKTRLLILPAKAKSWKYAAECADIGGGIMPNSEMRVAEVKTAPAPFIKLELPGRSPPACIKVSGEELALNFVMTTALKGPLPSGQNRLTRHRPAILAEAKRAGVQPAVVEEFFKYFEHGEGQQQGITSKLNTFLAGADTADNAIKVTKFVFFFRRLGFSLAEVSRILVVVVGMQSPKALALLNHVLRNGGRIEAVLKKTGNVRTGLSVAIAAISIYNLINQKEYSQAAATAYKSLMGIGVPWAGAIDAVQSFMPEVTPQTANWFKVLRACDPIGLGGVGIDSIVVISQSLVDAIQGKPFNEERLNQLVKRMKSGPTAWFAELGEKSGDALYDILQMDAYDWQLVGRYTVSQFGDWLRGIGR